MKLIKAFSLIELMVVIAIVAVLSAVAVPLYKEYRYKAITARAVVILDSFMSEYTQNLDKGVSNTVLNGIDFTSGFDQVVDKYPVKFVANYESINTICVYVLGLDGVLGYVSPSGTNNIGQRARICMQATYNDSSGVYKFSCGSWDYPNLILDIDPSLLPEGCNCASVGTGNC